MMKLLKIRNGSSIIEYMMIILFLSMAFFVFQHYIIRGFSGRWKMVGDSFGVGKQYDPKPYAAGGTLECQYYENRLNPQVNYWVATRCYEGCLRTRNGFGYEPDMAICRGQCHQSLAAYRDCCDTVLCP